LEVFGELWTAKIIDFVELVSTADPIS